MNLNVKVTFWILFKYFPQHKVLCSDSMVIQEIPLHSALDLKPKTESSGLHEEAKLDFQG